MSEQVIYFSNNVRSYSKNLKTLIEDISEEMNKGIKDGFAFKLANVENDDAKMYSFLKNEGYDINYKEFTGFISDCRETIDANEQLIRKVTSEQNSEELSDSDLEQVAGGTSWWKLMLIGIGAVLLLAAVVLSAGLATPLLAAAAIGASSAALTSAVIAGSGAVLIGCGVAAAVGTAAIITGAAV
jgi:hypothetical protein